MSSIDDLLRGFRKYAVGASLVGASLFGCEKEPVGPEPVDPVEPVDSVPSVPVVDSVRLKGVVSNEPFS